MCYTCLFIKSQQKSSIFLTVYPTEDCRGAGAHLIAGEHTDHSCTGCQGEQRDRQQHTPKFTTTVNVSLTGYLLALIKTNKPMQPQAEHANPTEKRPQQEAASKTYKQR